MLTANTQSVIAIYQQKEGESLHRVFISVHASNDRAYKAAPAECARRHHIFVDYSVDTSGISDALPAEAIREKNRDDYLRESTVTILLVGAENWGRKHVDCELYSSMIAGKINRKSSVLAPGAKVAVAPWARVTEDPSLLNLLLELTYQDRHICRCELTSACVGGMSDVQPTERGFSPLRPTRRCTPTVCSIAAGESRNINSIAMILDQVYPPQQRALFLVAGGRVSVLLKPKESTR